MDEPYNLQKYKFNSNNIGCVATKHSLEDTEFICGANPVIISPSKAGTNLMAKQGLQMALTPLG